MYDPNLLDIEREKLRTIIDGIAEGIVIVDSNQTIKNINTAAEDIIGYKRFEVKEKPVGDFLNLLDKENNLISPDSYSPKGKVDVHGVVFKKNSVNLIDKKDNVKVVKIESRKIQGGAKIDLGSIIFLEDVSKVLELERMKMDFMSMAVHVLRTPITVLKGYLSNLLKANTLAKLEQKEIEILNSSLSGVEELGILIENLLHLSEIQRGKFEIYPSPISLEGVVRSVVKDMKRASEAKGLALVVQSPLYEFPMVKADIKRIREVLINLIENAIKFTEEGSIQISVSIKEGFAQVAIKDTGRGIPPENIHYIFTKFYRVKDPLEMEEGTGIGLYVSKKIIDAHNGEIWVESDVGKGSTFYFTIPLSQ